MVLPALVLKIQALIGKVRKLLNAGAAAGLWPSKGNGPEIKK